MNTSEILRQIEALYIIYGYLIVFLSSFIETSPLGWAIPGGLMVAAGGFYAYGGEISLIGVVISAWIGMLLTFFVAYALGRKTGMSLAKKFGQEKNARKAKVLLEKHGPTILTTSLLANLTRFWTAYIAGAQNYPIIKFLFYSATASLTWTSLLVVVGYLAGSEKSHLEHGVAQLGILSWVILFIAIGIIYWKISVEFLKVKDKK